MAVITGSRFVTEALIASWNGSTLDAEFRSRRVNPADPHDVRYDTEGEPLCPMPYCILSKSQGNRRNRHSYSDAESRSYRNILFRFSVYADSPEVAADLVGLIMDLYDDASICPSQGGIIAIKYGGDNGVKVGDDEYVHIVDYEIVYEARTRG